MYKRQLRLTEDFAWYSRGWGGSVGSVGRDLSRTFGRVKNIGSGAKMSPRPLLFMHVFVWSRWPEAAHRHRSVMKTCCFLDRCGLRSPCPAFPSRRLWSRAVP
jgi:hypothetical protein